MDPKTKLTIGIVAFTMITVLTIFAIAILHGATGPKRRKK